MKTFNNILECLLNYDESSTNWIRPKSWRGTPQGLCVKHGQYYCVPSCKGGHPAHMPTKKELLEEWDIFDCYNDDGFSKE